MSITTTTAKIGDVPYVISKLPATKAMRVHLALGKAILEALASDGVSNGIGALAAGAKAPVAGAEASSEDQERVLTLVLRLFTALPGDDWQTPDGRKYMGLDSLTRVLLEHVKIAGKADVDPDACFDGKIGDLYRLLWEVLKHNFADFLGDVLSRSRQHAKAA